MSKGDKVPRNLNDGINLEVVEQFGPWMLEKQRICKPQSNQSKLENKTKQQKGKEKVVVKPRANHEEKGALMGKSKFSILDLVGEETAS